MKDYKEIIKLLQKNKEGLTITQIVEKSNHSRSKVRTILAYLEGSKKTKFRQIGMAKVYQLR